MANDVSHIPPDSTDQGDWKWVAEQRRRRRKKVLVGFVCVGGDRTLVSSTCDHQHAAAMIGTVPEPVPHLLLWLHTS